MSFLLMPVLLVSAMSSTVRAEDIAWKQWNPELFPTAVRQHRLVLLDLGAVWCHWCHVMEETTYRDPAVTTLLRDRFIPVRVDQDARPDLANHYEDYGWPATIIFDEQGRELVKMRGYIPPERMVRLLQAVVDDPTPGPSAIPEAKIIPTAGGLSGELRGELEQDFTAEYDGEQGGWGHAFKYIDADSIELALRQEREGSREAGAMARKTLDAARALIDPVWGGCYQYSTGGVWSEPHFEKIMPIQAEALRAYASAYAQWKRPQDRDTARLIAGYVRNFLSSPEGGFYTSQDADLHPGEHAGAYFRLADAERRALGIPRVDRHRYARDNGLMIVSLCAWYAASGERDALEMAVGAARWVIAQRTDGDGFRHDEVDLAGPYLSDTLAMGRACLALYGATGDRPWLDRASAAALLIAERFPAAGGAGYMTAASPGVILASGPQRDENLLVGRFANLLGHVTGDERYRAIVTRSLAYLAAPPIARRRPVAGVLQFHNEGIRPPLHIQILGKSRREPLAAALLVAALADPDPYKVIEWVASQRDPFALVCGATSCSPPLASVERLAAELRRSRGR